MSKPKKKAAKKMASPKANSKTRSPGTKPAPDSQAELDEPNELEPSSIRSRGIARPEIQAIEYGGKDIGQAFLLLEREGKISLYHCLSHGSSGQAFFKTWIYRGGPQPLNNERSTLFNYFKNDHLQENFGYTYQRARVQWAYIVECRACYLKAEADYIRSHIPDLKWKKGDDYSLTEEFPEPWIPGGQEGQQPGAWRYIQGPFQELLARWSREYLAEVERVSALFTDHPELGAYMTHLHEAIRDFQPGMVEGKLFIERLEAEQRGQDVLRTFRSAKERLVSNLAALAEEHTSLHDSGNDKLVWTEQVDLFGYLFTKLAEADFIRAPMKREGMKATVNVAKFGEQLNRHFTVEQQDGKMAKETAVKQSVKPSAHISQDTVDRLIAALQQEK
ncbi:MAG: hypothetical protein QM724_04240 [Flavobacteriales bacterium]